MFGHHKNKTAAPNTLTQFLEQADDALILAYEQKDIHAIIPFLHPRLIDFIGEEIKSGRDLTQELGLEKYRIRTWSEPLNSDNCTVIHKMLRHKDVKIRGMISIPVGDNIDEDWYVSKNNDKYVVMDIRRT